MRGASVVIVLPALFRDAARGCEQNSPVNHRLLLDAADDLEAGGVTADVMAGCQRDRGSAVPGLRFAGALHRLVLEGKGPMLAQHHGPAGGAPAGNPPVLGDA